MNKCFLCEIFENKNWEHVEFDEGKSQFFFFLVVNHFLSETEIWLFLRLLGMNSQEYSFSFLPVVSR